MVGAVALVVGTFVSYAPPFVQVLVERAEPPLADLIGKRTKVKITESTNVGYFVEADLEVPALDAVPDGALATFTIDAFDAPLVASGMTITITSPGWPAQGA